MWGVFIQNVFGFTRKKKGKRLTSWFGKVSPPWASLWSNPRLAHPLRGSKAKTDAKCQNRTQQEHKQTLLFDSPGSIKDWLELKHGQWSGSDEHQPWRSTEPEAADWIGDELSSWPKVQTLWTRTRLSSGVQPVAALPPWRQPPAHERRPSLLAQHPHWWDSFPPLILMPNSGLDVSYSKILNTRGYIQELKRL